jgi:hypothetical protein
MYSSSSSPTSEYSSDEKFEFLSSTFSSYLEEEIIEMLF